MRNYNKLPACIATGVSIVLATGALAISGEPNKTKATKFLANCPGAQGISHKLLEDSDVSGLQRLVSGAPDHHRVELTCDVDGTPPRIFGMSDKWQDDDPQVLVGQINQKYPGRVIVELTTDQEGDRQVTGPDNPEFYLNLSNTEPIVVTSQRPIESIDVYQPLK